MMNRSLTAFFIPVFLFALNSESCPTACLAAPAKAPAKAAPKKAPAKAPVKSSGAAQGPVSATLTAGYKSYAEEIKGKIGNNWWNYPTGKHHVVLTVTINPDGSASDMQLDSTPKNGEAEQAASDAFNKAQPFGPLPSGSPPCKLVATFDSTADQYTSKTNFQLKMDPFPQKPVTTQVPISDTPSP